MYTSVLSKTTSFNVNPLRAQQVREDAKISSTCPPFASAAPPFGPSTSSPHMDQDKDLFGRKEMINRPSDSKCAVFALLDGHNREIVVV